MNSREKHGDSERLEEMQGHAQRERVRANLGKRHGDRARGVKGRGERVYMNLEERNGHAQKERAREF